MASIRARPSRITIAENYQQRPRAPMDVWNNINENAEDIAPVRGISRRPARVFDHMRFLIEDADDIGASYGWGTNMETRTMDRIVTRSLENGEGYVKPIDKTAVLSKCRNEVYKSKYRGNGKSEAGQTECAVCLEKFKADDELLSLPCNHSFHKACLLPWIESNHSCCPCCRADVLAGGRKISDNNTIPSTNMSSGRGNGSYTMGSRSNSYNLTGSSSMNQGTVIRNVPIMSGRPPTSNNVITASSLSTHGGGGARRAPTTTVYNEPLTATTPTIRNVPVISGRSGSINNSRSSSFGIDNSSRDSRADMIYAFSEIDDSLDWLVDSQGWK